MRKIIILVNLFLCVTLHSQNYSFKKVYSEGKIIKIKGDISLVKDSITISYEGSDKTPIKIKFVVNTETYKEMVFEGEGYIFRLKLVDTSENKTLLFEMKDLFTNKITSILYYLII
jgi:hypothetical protein